MSTFVYPAYEPPINDRKINEFWVKAFNVNGRLYGLDVVETSGVLHIATGAFLSKGCIIHSDSTSISLSSAPLEPYYLYGCFNFQSTSHIGTFGISKLMDDSMAPIAKKSDGSWVMQKEITFRSLKNTIVAHDSSSDLHITENQGLAFSNSANPSDENLFVLDSDLTSNLNIIEDDLKLLPFSISGNNNINSIVHRDPQQKTIYDFVGNVDGGLMGLIDVASSAVKYADCGYIDRIFRDTLISSDDISTVSTSRCVASLSTTTPDFHKNTSIRVQIQSGRGTATIEWNPAGGLNFGTDTNYVASPIFIPTDSNLEYVELIVDDGLNTSKRKVNYSDLNKDKYNMIICPIYNLNSDSINYVKVALKYTDDLQSSYYYVGSLTSASAVKTLKLAETTLDIDTIRTSLLMCRKPDCELPMVDLSIDNGLNWIYDIALNKEIDVTQLEPVVTNQIKLTINMFNSGGDYYTVKTPWPIARPSSVMAVSRNSNRLVSIFGNNSSDIPQQTMHTYIRSSDSYSTGSNPAMARFGAGGNDFGGRLSVSGGRYASSMDNSFFYKSSTNVNIAKANLPEVRFNHGSCNDGEYKEYIWKGTDSVLMESNSLREFSVMRDTWLSKTSASGGQPHSSGNIISNKIYTTNDEVYNVNTESWASSGLSSILTGNAISVKLKTNLILVAYTNAYSVIDAISLISKSISLPSSTHRHSDSAMAAYDDDVVSFSSWEYNSIQYNDHTQYTPYLATRLNGFVVRYS